MRKLRDYEAAFYGVLFGIGVLCLWYFTSFVVEEKVIPKTADYIIQGFIILVTTSIGAGVGAYSAFWLKKHGDNSSEKNAQIAAINDALFVLIRQINAVDAIERDFNQFKNGFERSFILPAYQYPNYHDLKYDFQSLNFLVNKKKPQSVFALSIEQERFEQLLRSIENRNDFYVKELLPAITQNKLNDTYHTLSEYEEILGERLFSGANHGAITMYNLLASSKRSLNKSYKEWAKLSKEIFPDASFIRMEES